MNYARVLVTGASHGLGAALAREFAAQGRRVFLAARTESELQQRLAELPPVAAGPHAALAVDLADAASVERLAREAEARFGGIDVLVNNAAIGPYRPFTDNPPEDLQRLVTLNLTAPLLLTRLLLTGMLARGEGYLINVASDLARRPLANMAPYVASKFGLLGFAKSLHREVRDRGVKVTTVLPGIIDSQFNGAQEGSKEAHWALPTADLARQIAGLLDLPAPMVIDEMTVHPIHGDY